MGESWLADGQRDHLFPVGCRVGEGNLRRARLECGDGPVLTDLGRRLAGTRAEGVLIVEGLSGCDLDLLRVPHRPERARGALHIFFRCREGHGFREAEVAGVTLRIRNEARKVVRRGRRGGAGAREQEEGNENPKPKVLHGKLLDRGAARNRQR